VTDVQITSLLIGDPNNLTFTTDQITTFNQLAGVAGSSDDQGQTSTSIVSEYYFAACLALRAWAALVSGSLQEVKIGDYQVSGSKQAAALLDAADKFYDVYINTPAWAIIETNESDMTALVIIRNYVLRTNP
jgi:hypothetical protein